MEFTNEMDWLNSEDPASIARSCRGLMDVQRFRWLALEWGRRIRHLIDTTYFDNYEAWLVSERADPGAYSTDLSPDELFRGINWQNWYLRNVRNDPMLSSTTAAEAVCTLRPDTIDKPSARFGVVKTDFGTIHYNNGRDLQGKYQLYVRRKFCNQFRDVAGNPFRPVTLNPRWQTDNVSRLAQTIDETGQYHLMPILADALLEANANRRRC